MTAAKKVVFDQGVTIDLLDRDFEFFCQKISGLAGIKLNASKQELLKSRLRVRLPEHGLKDFREYRSYLESLPKNHPEWQEFINLLTTNKTDFFREPEHFNFVTETFVPEWLQKGERVLRVWSAAASTGEEAYTLSVVLNKLLPKDIQIKILATDIDTKVLATASNAVYPAHRINEIPPMYQREMLQVGQGSAAGWFRMRKEIKAPITFVHHNLLDPRCPWEEPFDLILCRNVMIYFSPETISVLIKKFFDATKFGGYLLIGHSESIQTANPGWKQLLPSVYRKGRL